MKDRTTLKMIVSFLLLIISGVLVVYTVVHDKANDTQLELSTTDFKILDNSIATNQHYDICGPLTQDCYSWEYVKGNIKDGVLTLGKRIYTLQSSDQLNVATLDMNTEAIINLQQIDNGNTAYLPFTTNDVIAKSKGSSICVEGKYVTFTKLETDTPYQFFTLKQNHSYVTLFSCFTQDYERQTLLDNIGLNFIQ